MLFLLGSTRSLISFELLRRRQFLELNTREFHLLELVGLRRFARSVVLCLQGRRNVDVVLGAGFSLLASMIGIDPFPEALKNEGVQDDCKDA